MAAEAGADTFAGTGQALVQGLLAAAEAGGDTVFADGQIYVVGSLGASETEADTFAGYQSAPGNRGVLVPCRAPVHGHRLAQVGGQRPAQSGGRRIT